MKQAGVPFSQINFRSDYYVRRQSDRYRFFSDLVKTRTRTVFFLRINLYFQFNWSAIKIYRNMESFMRPYR